MSNSRSGLLVFYRHSKPNVRWCAAAVIALINKRLKKRATLGQHLIDVPICPFHCVKDRCYVRSGDPLVKKIAHGIYKNHPRTFPGEWLQKPLRPKRQIEASFKWVPQHSAESFGKSRGVTIVTSGADLCAPRDWVPGCVCPFDCAVFRHPYSASTWRSTKLFNEVKPHSRPLPKIANDLNRFLACGARGPNIRIRLFGWAPVALPSCSKPMVVLM